MNELEAQLAKVVEKSLSLAEKTGDFVIEQAPMLLQEFYMWHTAKAIMGIVACLFAFALFGYGFKRMLKKMEEDSCFDWDEPFAIVFTVVGVVVTVCAAIELCINVYNLVFITVAPKLYLIEYFIK